jgi:hypothetical protein
MSDNQSTFDLEDVEIFETGNHKGDEYTEKDLDDMVQCFQETKGRLKPYVKLGHNPGQILLQQDGMPAAGWITDLKRNGSKLLANFSSVPKKIKDLIDKKAYGRFSSEIFWNGKIDNKDYRRGIRAVALLGGDTPAVQTLNDFINLYTDNKVECEIVKIYDEEADMAENEKFLETLNIQLKEYSDKLAEAAKKEVAFSLKITDLEGQIKELKTKIDAEEKAKAKLAAEAKENEVKMFIDSAIKDLKIAPAQKDKFFSLAMKDFDNVKDLVKDMPKITDSKINSENVESKSDKQYSEMTAQEKEDHIDEQIKEYIAENKDVTYRDAYSVIKEKLEGK